MGIFIASEVADGRRVVVVDVPRRESAHRHVLELCRWRYLSIRRKTRHRRDLGHPGDRLSFRDNSSTNCARRAGCAYVAVGGTRRTSHVARQSRRRPWQIQLRMRDRRDDEHYGQRDLAATDRDRGSRALGASPPPSCRGGDGARSNEASASEDRRCETAITVVNSKTRGSSRLGRARDARGSPREAVNPVREDEAHAAPMTVSTNPSAMNRRRISSAPAPSACNRELFVPASGRESRFATQGGDEETSTTAPEGSRARG
jgi:hypothetical protein